MKMDVCALLQQVLSHRVVTSSTDRKSSDDVIAINIQLSPNDLVDLLLSLCNGGVLASAADNLREHLPLLSSCYDISLCSFNVYSTTSTVTPSGEAISPICPPGIASMIVSSSLHLSRDVGYTDDCAILRYISMIAVIQPHFVVSSEDTYLNTLLSSHNYSLLASIDLFHLSLLQLPPRSMHSPTSVFVLAGQSNMSGRGRLQDLSNTSIEPSHMTNISDAIANKSVANVYSCDPLQHWTIARYSYSINAMNLKLDSDGSTLHRNTDILKTVGIGPGTSFAIHYNNLQSSTDHTTGLIPCAVGATSSHEWAPSYIPSAHPASSIPMPTILSPLQALARHRAMYVTCYNYLSCLFRMLYCSLHRTTVSNAVTVTPAIDGLLWHQGCNDAGMADAESYTHRTNVILNYIKEYAPLVADIYNHQYLSNYILSELPITLVAITTTRPWLQYTSSIRQQQLTLGGVAVVDALGGILCADSVHLQAEEYVKLGILLAQAMQKHTTATPCTTITTRLLDMNEWKEWIEEYSRIRAHVESKLSVEAMNKPISSGFPILSTGLKAVNFVYGEITYGSALHILRMAIRNQEKPMKLVDLGCGSGVVLAAGYKLGLKVCGIEMMRSKLDIAREYFKSATNAFDDDWSIIEGNFLEIDWRDATLVYICATCFADDQMATLRSQCAQLKPKSQVLIMDKYNFAGDVEGVFELISSCQCEATWGIANVYLYEKL